MSPKGIFIGATGQNVGKTTSCLGVMSLLKKKYNSVGFMKPVGQRTVDHGEGEIDKDVGLFKKCFNIATPGRTMSPVVFPAGFTRKYLDGEIKEEELIKSIQTSYTALRKAHDFVLVEGTGHTGVGALCSVHNAHVAALLNLDVILVTNAGLGSAFDELVLNKALYDLHGVSVRGVILNRVLESKKEMLSEYFSKSLKKLNIPLLGLIPFNPLLENPTVKDYADLFKTDLISGKEHLLWHFEHFRFVGTTLKRYQEVMVPNQLVITPATREDIILAKIKQHEETEAISDQGVFGGGVLLTGLVPPTKRIIKALKASSIPSLYARVSAYDALKKIHLYTAKIGAEDDFKITKAIQHVERHIDIEPLFTGKE